MDQAPHYLDDLSSTGRSVRLVRYHRGVPAFQYAPTPDQPPVTLSRPGVGDGGVHAMRHIHDFPILLTDCRTAWLVTPGQVIDPRQHHIDIDCVAVIFDPAAVDVELSAPFRHERDPVIQIDLPADRHERWAQTLAGLAAELSNHDDHSRRAVLAHLTMLLVDVARVQEAAANRPDESIATVFAVIEQRYATPLTLADVAADVGFSPAYLTTLVRRRTGKTVMQWITERRMVEARRLLADTDLPIATIANRVGFDDPAYFSRVFSREIGTAPRRWRGTPA